MILNTKNKNFYIGSTNNFDKRIRSHKRALDRNEHHSTHLQRSYNKYGKRNFIFQIFMPCCESDLLILEQFCLDFLNPVYNVSKDAVAPMSGRKHSEKTKAIFRSVERAKGKDHYFYGKKWSSERREKILASRIGKRHSKETKKKMSETAHRINSISRIDHSKQRKPIIDNLENEFLSIKEAAAFHNISMSTVCDILKGRSLQTRKGVSFEYI
jgi:group I intron endonuclease